VCSRATHVGGEEDEPKKRSVEETQRSGSGRDKEDSEDSQKLESSGAFEYISVVFTHAVH